MSTTGVLYIRVSSDEQVKGTSLDEQLDACHKYCKENNIKVLGVFREEGASAKSAEREQFLDAIEFCRKHRVNAFVVWKTDRFARNLQDHYAVKSTLVKYGTKLYSVTEKFTDDPTGKLLEGMMVVIAEFDNDIRRQRCSGGMLGRIKKGIWPWHPPIGYLCLQNKKQDKKKETPDPIDPVNFPILKRALRDLAKKPYTLKDFAGTLNRDGLITTKNGAVDNRLADRILTYHLRFFAGILENPFYPHTGEQFYKGGHEAMITEDEMVAIQKNRIEKKRNEAEDKADRINRLFPLKGTLFCHECGRKVTGSSTRGNGGIYNYYHCFNLACTRRGKILAKAAMEEQFLWLVSDITPSRQLLEQFRSLVIDTWNSRGRKCDVAMVEKYDLEMAVIYATSFISNLGRTWFDLPREVRPQFQNLVFPEGVLVDANKKLRTTKVGFIYNLERPLTPRKTELNEFVDPTGIEPVTSSLQMRRSTK